MTCLAWHVWCELLGSLLYDLMSCLDEPEYLAFNRGFDAEHRRLFPAFYLD